MNNNNLRSVVIVTIDVKHLVSLDTEHTIAFISSHPQTHNIGQLQHTRTGRIPSNLQTVSINASDVVERRGSFNIPVPSTTTSYSGAISSIMEHGKGDQINH